MRLTRVLALPAFLIFIIYCINCASVSPVSTEKEIDYDVIIVGGGLGGLSAGAHLATGGMKVLLLEQHHKVGGCTTSFSRGEFNFDVALHEMAGGGSGEKTLIDLMKLAGVYDKVELIKIKNLYRAIYPGVDFTYPGDLDAAIKALSERWPHERRGIVKFHRLMGEIHTEAQAFGDLYRKGFFYRNTVMVQAPFKQEHLFKYLMTPVQDILDECFSDPEIKAVVSQFWVYYGPPPSRLWSIIFMSANYSYLKYGSYQVMGSSQALSNAYASRIKELGGVVKTGTLVTSIMVEKGKAVGVKTENSDTFTSRYVVSNADPFQTFFTLVGKEKTPAGIGRKIRKLKPGVSLVGVYMGLDVPPSFWNCTDHEIFYNSSLDPDENYKNMMAGNYEKGAAAITFYTNLGDPFYSPPGKSVLVIHAYSEIKMWPEDRDQYREMKERVGDQLITLAENVLPGLKDHIVVKEIITPRTLKAFTMQKDGIPYGWDFTPSQGLRLTNDTPIKGLYLAGSWTNPGHGVGTAQISGYQAAMLILDVERGK